MNNLQEVEWQGLVNVQVPVRFIVCVAASVWVCFITKAPKTRNCREVPSNTTTTLILKTACITCAACPLIGTVRLQIGSYPAVPGSRPLSTGCIRPMADMYATDSLHNSVEPRSTRAWRSLYFARTSKKNRSQAWLRTLTPKDHTHSYPARCSAIPRASLFLPCWNGGSPI